MHQTFHAPHSRHFHPMLRSVFQDQQILKLFNQPLKVFSAFHFCSLKAYFTFSMKAFVESHAIASIERFEIPEENNSRKKYSWKSF